MIKQTKIMLALACMLSISSYQTTQARSMPAIVAGSVLAAGGVGYTSWHANPFMIFLSSFSNKDSKTNTRHILAGLATTAAGLCLLAYGAGK